MKWLSLVMIFMVLRIEAHNPAETYATITVEENQIVVALDMPWTLVNAVKQAYPECIYPEMNRQESLDLILSYILKNFSIQSTVRPFPLIRSTFMDAEEEHGFTFELIFRRLPAEQIWIENSVLTNYNQDQINIHTVVIDGSESPFITTKDQPAKQIELPSKEKNKSIVEIKKGLLILWLSWIRLFLL